MNGEKATVAELELVCERRGCHWQDLFLIGKSAYIGRGGDRSLPTEYEPLLLDDLAFAAKLPELLRRLDAVEFESLHALRDRLAMAKEFRILNNELHELLSSFNGGRSPDGKPFYLEADDCGVQCQQVHCDPIEAMSPTLVEAIRKLLVSYSRDWEVSVTTGSFEKIRTVMRIFKSSKIEEG